MSLSFVRKPPGAEHRAHIMARVTGIIYRRLVRRTRDVPDDSSTIYFTLQFRSNNKESSAAAVNCPYFVNTTRDSFFVRSGTFV